MRNQPGCVLALLAVAAAAASRPVAAQNPWGASYYPYPLKSPNEKISLILHYQYAQTADYDQPVPFAGSFSAEGGANADGGRFITGRFKGPLLVKDWRFLAEAGSVRESRFGYFGLGNDTEAEEDPDNPYLNRVRRRREFFRADVSRRLVGPLWLSAGGGVVHANFSSLPGDSRYLQDCSAADPAAPFDGSDCATETDVIGRVSAILDTRDNEFVTSRGVLLEAGVFSGTGGGGYLGYYGLASAFLPLREGTVLAARVLGRHVDEEAPLDARFEVFAWERTISVAGGPESHRSYLYGRYTGRDVVVANAELRQDILNFGDFGAITAVGFVDAVQAHEHLPGESDDLHLGGGGGIALRILRSTILTFNFAGGGDGFQFSMGTGFSF